MAEVTAHTEPVVRLEAIHKAFGGIVALHQVDLDVFPGEIVALVGDNGAGKSTLIKTIAGVHQPTSGSVILDGQPVNLTGPNDSRRHGIEVVYQDLALADRQPVYLNMFLGRELVRGPLRLLDRKRMIRETQTLLDDLDIRVASPRVPVSALSGGQRQGVAIGRATRWAQRMVLMDEPTAALGVQEQAKVLRLIEDLKANGTAVVVVSHNLQHVFHVADRIVVLRGGRHAGERLKKETTPEEIVRLIVGADRLVPAGG